MTDALLLREQDRQEILRLLARHLPDVAAWAYGSRVNGGAHEGSDLDIVLRSPDLSPIPLEELRAFVQALRDSNIPILVEARDWARLPESFQREIMKNYVVLRETVSEWRECSLGDLLEFISKGTTPEKFTCSGINYVKSQSITYDGKIDTSLFEYIDEETHEKFKRSQLRTGDILFSMAGVFLGKNAIVTEEILPANTNQALAILRLDKNKCVTKYIHYFLRLKSTIETVNNISGQSAQPNINFQEIKSLSINLPPLTEQKAISSILSSLDDKIDLLHRQNKTLEAMAEALFRQWFVEEAGEDWEDGKIEDLFVLQRGFDLPSHVRNEGHFPVYAASGLNGFHDEYKIKAPGVTTGRSGLLGKVFFVQDDFWPLNTSLFIKEFERATPLFAYFLLKNIDLEAFNSGSAVPSLNRNHVHNYELIIPPKDLIDKFESVTIGNFLKIKANQKQIRTLEQLRDTLLPKLMSGEVRVTC